MATTIAIPFHRERLEFFELAVRSVFAQTYTDWELLLLADGADSHLTDAARAIQDSRVRVINDERNLGLGQRLNQAAALARTPYLARMDADDVMLPTRIARQLSALEEDSRLDLLGGRAYVIDEAGQVVGLHREPPMAREHAELLVSNGFTHPTVMGKSEWFRRNPYDVSIRRAEDKELWLRTFPDARFAKLEGEPVLGYRVPRVYDRQKAVLTCRDDRRATLPYAAALGGWRTKTGYAAKSLAKQAVYQVAGDLVWRRILAGRAELLDGRRLDEAQRVLESVRFASVPGWQAE